jgi:hypothetical protein
MRKTDKNPKTYFRSERIFSMNGNWYFATREGEQGPFASRNRAEAGLRRHLSELEQLEAFQQSRIKKAQHAMKTHHQNDSGELSAPAASAQQRERFIY